MIDWLCADCGTRGQSSRTPSDCPACGDGRLIYTTQPPMPPRVLAAHAAYLRDEIDAAEMERRIDKAIARGDVLA